MCKSIKNHITILYSHTVLFCTTKLVEMCQRTAFGSKRRVMPPEQGPVQVEGEGREGVDETGGQLVQTVEH